MTTALFSLIYFGSIFCCSCLVVYVCSCVSVFHEKKENHCLFHRSVNRWKSIFFTLANSLNIKCHISHSWFIFFPFSLSAITEFSQPTQTKSQVQSQTLSKWFTLIDSHSFTHFLSLSIALIWHNNRDGRISPSVWLCNCVGESRVTRKHSHLEFMSISISTICCCCFGENVQGNWIYLNVFHTMRSHSICRMNWIKNGIQLMYKQFY